MVKILFLAANPLDSTRLRLDKEIREIDEKLRQSELRDLFEISSHWAVRVRDLQGLILRYKPNIVHFSGHGSASSEIVLEDNFGNSHPVSVRSLSQLFSVLKDDIQCVVLNACYSEKQAQAIAEHIDYVIGMSKAITDSAAISFALAFYQALGFGQDVRTAFKLGCIQVDLENLHEQDTPKLIENRRLSNSVHQASQESEDFFHRTQHIREEDRQFSDVQATVRNQHWDRFQSLVDSLEGNDKVFVQKTNTLHYLA
jgi:hypothetical protein